MLNWAKQQLANVAGTQEPIYGPTAIQSVTKQAESSPHRVVRKEDQRWAAMDSTCVETQTFYLVSEVGQIGLVQVIYSNVAGIRTTCQFNTKIFYTQEQALPHLWSSNPLEDCVFDDEMYSFRAKGVFVDLSEDGSSYTIKSEVNDKSLVDLKFARAAPGFVVGENGTSYFGTDPEQPWGRMRHLFWPRCRVQGSILTHAGKVDFAGRGLFVHALQGMKPHHAAARWNFVNFQGPAVSAVLMEYTTPASYGSTTVAVGGIARDGEIIYAGATNSVSHTEIANDPENEWPVPIAVDYIWKGVTAEGRLLEAHIAGSLGQTLDRVDVMAEVPKFVKQIVAGAAGTKPYIYQYAPALQLNLHIADEQRDENGVVFTEATFIS